MIGREKLLSTSTTSAGAILITGSLLAPASSSRIVATPSAPAAPAAKGLPLGAESTSEKVSLASSTVSPNTGTDTAATVWPGTKVSTPCIGSKSLPELAVPGAVV